MKSNGVSSLINSQRSERSITSADTDEMEEFDDESSGVEGSDDSEEPKVEDTISLDSDSEPEPNVDSTTVTGSKQQTEDDEVEEILSDNNSGDDEQVVEDKQKTSEMQSTPIANGVKDLTTKQIIQNNSTDKQTSSVSIINDTISFNKGSLSITHIKSSKSTNSAVNPTALFERFAARGTTVTPIVNKTSTNLSATVQTPSIVLQSLSDDMFVVEAPSFIVPYVYEKPSVKPFRRFVDELEKELKKLRAEEVVKDDEEKLNSFDEDVHSEKGQKKTRTEDDVSASDSEAASDAEKVSSKESDVKDPLVSAPAAAPRLKSDNYFENPLGKFFMNIGSGLVQEYVQNDLLKQQKRKLRKERKSGLSSTKNTESTIKSLIQNLEYSKDSNAPYKFEQKKCEICDFKSESAIVIAHHLETPHMKNNIYKCNFCKFEIRSPHDVLFHIETVHNINARLVRALAYHQCANCPFEDNAKGKLARHLIGCAKRFKPEINLAPPVEWEPPAKLPKMREVRKNMMGSGGVYLPSMTRPKGHLSMLPNPLSIAGMPPLTFAKGALDGRSGVTIRPTLALNANKSRGYPNLINSQVNNLAKMSSVNKVVQGPSRALPPPMQPKPSPAPANFVVCEICDGYIQDLEMLRHHMQWIHKIKIHPKLIFSRPPLNCQKCQLRFFTDQGLERHLLGSHGLVTSSMQEAANKGKDAGRCPVCGKSYQHNLLSHVSREHKMTLKPAHLSYKCTVCTAKFTMYKQFEEHVYSAHSVVAKRIADKNKLNSTPKQTSMVR